jgi:hypothetical protein
MTTPTKPAVVITRCGKCGLEHVLFRRWLDSCPRCDAPNSRHTCRTIRDPHPETIQQAQREEYE